MMRRVVRVVVRLAGWLLTPLVLTLAAFLGATIMAMVAPVVSTTVAMALVTLAGLTSAAVGLWLWIRLLKGSPVLQEALAVTPEGVPLEAEVDAMLGTAEQPGVP
ncbi:MAG: hypothetical protein IPG05_12310 [Gemmatimonadetes bacterium]|nr:hypothetical protein [Gemmatimonadota bacterium]